MPEPAANPDHSSQGDHRQFDVETAIRPLDEPGVFHADLTDQWNIGVNPNGGYAASVLQRALLAVTPHPVPISVTTHYVRPALALTPARVETEVIRAGRSTSTASGRLVQNGKERLRMVASFGAAATDDIGLAAHNDRLVIPPVDWPEPDECVARATLAQGIDLPILNRVDVRIPAHLADESGQEVTGGWIRFGDGRPPDLASLALFCDAFPPSPFGLLGRLGWVPTLELTVHVRQAPADGWIRARFETCDLRDGLLVEDGVLWDSTGTVVAQCRQLALLRVEQQKVS